MAKLHHRCIIALFIGSVAISNATADAPANGTNAPPPFDPEKYLAEKNSALAEASKDPVEAAKWYLKAAEQGYEPAQYDLGMCYRFGIGVPKDEAEAAKWWRKAADKGNARDACALGRLYVYGEGKSKNVPEGLKWYLKAAMQGDEDAQLDLAKLYHDGGTGIFDGQRVIFDNSVPKDIHQAVKWYTKAAEQGNAVAANFLADIYAEGDGVVEDGAAAVKWYRNSLIDGDSKSGFDGRGYVELAGLYRSGDCVPKDELEALAWAYLAKSVGITSSYNLVNQLENQLGPQASLIAQQRSKELLVEIEKEKQARANAPKTAFSDSITGNAQSQPKAFGSGVFISADGLFLTAAHVIEGASSVKVLTQQGTMNVKIMQVDRANDVALLKCEGTFVPVTVRPSGGVKLGQTVFTLGYPDIQIQGGQPENDQGGNQQSFRPPR